MSQCIDNGIGDCLWRTYSGRLTDALGPDGMMRRGCNRLIRLPGWCLHRGGDQVVHEVATQDVTILIESYLFIHRRCKSLGQTTMNLPLDHHRIDNRAAVIHRHKAANVHLTRAAVDIYDTDVASEWIGEIGRVVVVHRFQAWL